MSSLTDLLTAAKNIVVALNNASQTYLNVQGAITIPAINEATVIHTGKGRVCNVSVIAAGDTVGIIYDNDATTLSSNPIYVIPRTVGVHVVNLPISVGILVVPGANQTVAVSHS